MLTSGSVTFVAGANFDVEIEGPLVGTEYDQLIVNGAVALGGATLNLSGLHEPDPGSLESL